MESNQNNHPAQIFEFEFIGYSESFIRNTIAEFVELGEWSPEQGAAVLKQNGLSNHSKPKLRLVPAIEEGTNGK